MSRLVRLALASGLVLATACAPSTTSDGTADPMDTTPAEGVATAAPADDDPRTYVVDPEVRNVMYAKLRHAHVLLDALTVADFARIEQNARELAWLSQLAEWRVHDTPEYVEFSEQFRGIMLNMAEQAQARNLFAVREAHVEMTASCAECHAYLRREGLVPELPGAVSRLQVPHPSDAALE